MKSESSPILLETIVVSRDDAREAVQGGADRFELCSALALGGLTPSLGTVRSIREEVELPVMCMVRPREGGMAYSEGEVEAMLRDAELLLESGAEGLVFGFLTPEGNISLPHCRQFLRRIEQSAPHKRIQTVFHRAFDVVADPKVALEQLVDLGVTRVLTSGRAPTALQGIEEIRRVIDQADGRIEVLPGGGIDLSSVAKVVGETNATQVHLYLTDLAEDTSTNGNRRVYFGAHLPGSENEYRLVSREKVRAVKSLLEELTG